MLPLKDDFKPGQPLKDVQAEWLNTVARVLNEVETTDGPIHKTYSGHGWLIPSGGQVSGDAFPWDKLCFGYELPGGTTMRVKGGTVTIGTVEYSCGDYDLDIATEYSYIGWEFVWATGVLTIKDFGSSFTTDSAYLRRWLYYVHSDGSSLSVVRYGLLNEFLPANWGQS